jgi:hypothetical protein
MIPEANEPLMPRSTASRIFSGISFLPDEFFAA